MRGLATAVSGARALLRRPALLAPVTLATCHTPGAPPPTYAYAAGAPPPPPRQFAGAWGFAATVTVGLAGVSVAECTGSGSDLTLPPRAGTVAISRGAAAGALGVGSQGESESWKSQQVNVMRIFEEFREFNNNSGSGEGNPNIPSDFHGLQEGALCNESVFSRFAGYLTDHYVKPSGAGAGQHLSSSSACDYLNCALQQANSRFGTSSVYGPTTLNRHVIDTHSKPSFLDCLTSYDVASIIPQALRPGRTRNISSRASTPPSKRVLGSGSR
jgi:hypothetical protein